ncbi:23199_t:CDS:1, partial [Cetraspora pellucida]
INIDQQIKKYIDSACQATTAVLIEKVKELINQQNENQKHWNEQIQTTINERLNKLEQVGLMDGEPDLNNNQPTEEKQSNLTIPITICSSAETRNDIIQDNYPPTSTINRRIVNLTTQDTAFNADNVLSIIRHKAHKYQSIDYLPIKQF